MTAYLFVRAEVPDADRQEFDRWSETEHLPDAKAAIDVLTAWRGWSDIPPGLHVAAYEISDLFQARRVLGSSAIDELIAEFDCVWQGRVSGTRQIVGVEQLI